MRGFAAATFGALAILASVGATQAGSTRPATSNLARCVCIGGSCGITASTIRSRRELSGGRFRPLARGNGTDPLQYPRVVGSNQAVLFTNFPGQDAQEFAFLKKYLASEHFDVTIDSNTGTSPGSAILANFLAAAKAGVFVYSTHGVEADKRAGIDFFGLLVEEYASETKWKAAWARYDSMPQYQGGVLAHLGPYTEKHVKTGDQERWGIFLTDKGIHKFFGGATDQIVFGGSCYSWDFSAVSGGFGADAYFGYTNVTDDDFCDNDWETLFLRLIGNDHGGLYRSTLAAWKAGGFTTDGNVYGTPNGPTTTLRADFAESHAPELETADLLLSPAVSTVALPESTAPNSAGANGPFAIDFDAAMDTSVDPGSILSATGGRILSPKWVSPVELDFSLLPNNCAAGCTVPVTINAEDAVSAGPFQNDLDGNTDPSWAKGLSGVEPIGDNYQFKLAFTPAKIGYDAGGSLMAMDPNGSNRERLISNAGGESWAANGSSLLSDTGGRITLIHPGNPKRTVLKFIPAGAYPLLSPDGASVAWANSDQDTLTVASIDGKNVRRAFPASGTRSLEDFYWYPDSTRLLVSAWNYGSEGGPTDPSPYVADTATDAISPVRITGLTADENEIEQPSVSWDGSRVTFEALDGNSLDFMTSLYTAPSTGGSARVVTTVKGEVRSIWDPQFSPDGRTIAFDDDSYGSDESTIWIVPTAGGTPTSTGVKADYWRWIPPMIDIETKPPGDG